jgi:3-hydroxybutyryl-CoA dehydrogenase
MKIEDIRKVGVVGAGSMGAGIAQVAAQSGFEVSVVDVSEASWARAQKTIAKSLERLANKEKITQEQMKEALGRIRFPPTSAP